MTVWLFGDEEAVTDGEVLGRELLPEVQQELQVGGCADAYLSSLSGAHMPRLNKQGMCLPCAARAVPCYAVLCRPCCRC